MTRVVAEGVAAPDRDRKTLNAFFTALGANCPNAVRCADAFHIVAWAGDAQDQVRRDTWNAARKGG